MALPSSTTFEDRLWFYASRAMCFAVLAFLLLALPMPGLSWRWYQSLVETDVWLVAARNSLFIGIASTMLALILGTLAALGLSRARFALKPVLVGLIVAPIIVPIVITAVAMYFFFAELDLTSSYTGLVLAHTALSVPFVVITVHASLSGFDHTLMRAAATLGASPLAAFRRIMLPIIFPGVASGGLFAFVTSFDEIVVTLFIAGPSQRTVPRQIFSGVREYVSPGIAAVATLLILLSAILLVAVQLLQRRTAALTIGAQGNRSA
jgi:putative spermidine/putrescine transport system permease protein